MGNSSSAVIRLSYDDAKSESGKCQSYVAGRQVSGSVFLAINKPLSNAHDLNLFAVGKEICSARKGKSIQRASRVIFQMQIKLRNAEETDRRMDPGKYEFPFSFSLPDSLPSSFRSAKNKRNFCSIQYQIIAKMKQICKESREFIVSSAPMSPNPIEYTVAPITTNLNFITTTNTNVTSIPAAAALLLPSRGTFSFACRVPDVHVQKGGVTNVILACINQSTTKIEKITIKVIERIGWSANRGHGSVERVLYSNTDVPVPSGLEKKTRLEVIRATRDKKRNRRNNNSTGETDRSQKEEEYEKLYDDLLAGQNFVQVLIPENARDTYSGTALWCRHFIVVKFKTSFFVGDPTVEIPIHVGFKEHPSLSQNQNQQQRPQMACTRSGNIHYIQTEAPVASVPLNIQPSSSLQQQQQQQEPVVARAIVPMEWQSPDRTIIQASLVTAQDESFVRRRRETLTVTTIQTNTSSDNDNDDDDNIDISANTSSSEMEWLSSSMHNQPIIDDSISLSTLLDQMETQLATTTMESHFDLISGWLVDSAWKNVFSNLSPDDFGLIVSKVKPESDQPKVAEIMARCINNGIFTCDYCVAAIRSTTAPWNRTILTERLMPLCVDLDNHRHLIQNELTQWEMTVSSRRITAQLF